MLPRPTKAQWASAAWRLDNLYQITDKAGNKIPFRLNEPQREMLEGMHSRNIILKARQRGVTTFWALVFLDQCLWVPNTRAAIIAHKLDDAKVIFATKIRDPYMDLPDVIRKKIPSTQDAADTLSFKNGSSIRVSTSTRSGTVQWLLVSEYGKIVTQFAEKAREIRTGAFPSAEQGTIVIESTAEGNDGDFFQKCQAARANPVLSRLDFKFFFFPWWSASEYQLKQGSTAEGPEDLAYFTRLEIDLGIKLTQPQRNWWLTQEKDLGGDMLREYPATADEAFEAALEGCYFVDQIAVAEKHGRIGDYPVDPGLPVNTCWDLGRGDDNVIWLWQDHNELATFVGVYANSGEWIGHYIDWLNEWRKDHNTQWGKHYLPHDGDVKTLWIPGGTMEVMANLKFMPEIVQRSRNKIETINTARRKFQKCAFDRNACKTGLEQLKRYRKDWNERFGVWRNEPRHDTSSHYADALMTFTESEHIPLPPLVGTRRERYRDTPQTRDGSWMSA